MALTVDEILGLYCARGARLYGSEPVPQLAHALQCATRARAEGAAPALVAAAFLHDLGHLLVPEPHSLAQQADDWHQYVAIPFLRGTFSEAVLEPIRLHVEAKRFLCAVEVGYRDRLSAASRHSLALQGGPMSAPEAERFLAQPYALDAVRLRRWDDGAKVPGLATAGLGEVAALLRALSHKEGTPPAACGDSV